jgi:hypothetical protein
MRQNDLFDKKHATMWRISMWANGLAPITLLLYVVLAFLQIYQYSQVATINIKQTYSAYFPNTVFIFWM